MTMPSIRWWRTIVFLDITNHHRCLWSCFLFRFRYTVVIVFAPELRGCFSTSSGSKLSNIYLFRPIFWYSIEKKKLQFYCLKYIFFIKNNVWNVGAYYFFLIRFAWQLILSNDRSTSHLSVFLKKKSGLSSRRYERSKVKKCVERGHIFVFIQLRITTTNFDKW